MPPNCDLEFEVELLSIEPAIDFISISNELRESVVLVLL